MSNCDDEARDFTISRRKIDQRADNVTGDGLKDIIDGETLSRDFKVKASRKFSRDFTGN
jgi:hypothetical protein